MPFESNCQVIVQQISDERWKLVEPLIYRGNEDTFEVAAGFETDFASVPRIFWSVVPRYGRYTRAAILHDYLVEEARHGRFNRCDADGIFRRSMRELGVPFITRWIMWAAVRLGGNPFCCGPGSFFRTMGIVILSLPIALVGAVVLLLLGILWVLESIIQLFSRQPKQPKEIWWC